MFVNTLCKGMKINNILLGMGCARGIAKYITCVQLAGFSDKNLTKVVEDLKKSCSLCIQKTMCFTAKSPIYLTILLKSGPNDFKSISTTRDPLSCLVINQAGSVFVVNPNLNQKKRP